MSWTLTMTLPQKEENFTRTWHFKSKPAMSYSGTAKMTLYDGEEALTEAPLKVV